MLCAIVGLYAAVKIHTAKQTKTKLACPRTSSCDRVIHSTYATTFHIPNDVVGIVFYIAVLVLMVLTPVFSSAALVLALLISIGFLFSLYLLCVQLFVLRTWCAWCMLSALSSIGLFVTLVLPAILHIVRAN